jgi:hypothetical protein
MTRSALRFWMCVAQESYCTTDSRSNDMRAGRRLACSVSWPRIITAAAFAGDLDGEDGCSGRSRLPALLYGYRPCLAAWHRQPIETEAPADRLVS